MISSKFPNGDPYPFASEAHQHAMNDWQVRGTQEMTDERLAAEILFASEGRPDSEHPWITPPWPTYLLLEAKNRGWKVGDDWAEIPDHLSKPRDLHTLNEEQFQPRRRRKAGSA